MKEAIMPNPDEIYMPETFTRCGDFPECHADDHVNCDVRPLQEVLESYMEARDELRAEATGILALMEADVLPEGSVHWTGEFKYVDENGQVVDHDSMEGAVWFQYRDKAGIELWACFAGDSYLMADGEW
jgi:hypothetical protein